MIGLRGGSVSTVREADMVGTYAVHWDAEANRVDFALAGAWDCEVMDRWQTELEAALAAARPGWTLVCDLTVYDLDQDPTVARRQARLVESWRCRGMARGAFVLPRAATLWKTARRRETGLITGLVTDETRAVATREEALAFVEGR